MAIYCNAEVTDMRRLMDISPKRIDFILNVTNNVFPSFQFDGIPTHSWTAGIKYSHETFTGIWVCNSPTLNHPDIFILKICISGRYPEYVCPRSVTATN